MLKPRPLLGLLLPVLLVACSLVPDAPVPEQISELDEEFARAGQADGDEQVERWKAFDDAVLNRVVEGELGSNFDLDEAVTRVGQAKARARMASAARLPAMQGAIGPNQIRMPTSAGLGAQLDELGLGSDVFEAFGFVLPDRLDLTTYSAGAEFAYEVDFWLRDRNGARAAGAESLAAESDLHTARIRVLADTMGTYFEVVDLRHQRRLAGEIVEFLKEWEWLMETRYGGGLADAQSLYAVRRQLGKAEAELPQLEALLANAEARLWVLVGGYSEELAGMLPHVLTTGASLGPAPGRVPAYLLVQRPRCEGGAAKAGGGPIRRRGAPRGTVAIAVVVRFDRSAEFGVRRLVRSGSRVPQSECEPARAGAAAWTVAGQSRTCPSQTG